MHCSEKISLIPIAGMEPMTTIDFPGRIAAVVFTQGCQWNCPYCHNPSLQKPAAASPVPYGELVEFMASRAGFLDGIVVTGGEPTMHPGIVTLLGDARRHNYETALHTNGSRSGMVKKLIGARLVDYVALDIKGPPERYDGITGRKNSCIEVSRTLDVLMNNDVEFECRTTWHPDILSEADLMRTVQVLAGIGVPRYFIQRFRREGVENELLRDAADVETVPDHITAKAAGSFGEFAVR